MTDRKCTCKEAVGGGVEQLHRCENEVRMKRYNSSPGYRRGDITLLSVKHDAHGRHRPGFECAVHCNGGRNESGQSNVLDSNDKI